MPNLELFVSTEGDDRWSGRIPGPNASGTDGPLATLARARDLVRELKTTGRLAGPVTFRLRGGRYPVSEAVVFGPQDSGAITYAAFDDEKPVVDGGVRIEGWEKETINGVEALVTTIPEVAEGRWYFRQLWVEGERRLRPRLPREGFRRIEDVPGHTTKEWFFTPCERFVVAEGDVRQWRNLTDVEIVALHFWIEERIPIATFDEETRLVTSSRKTRMLLKNEKEGWAKYYVDNVFEELQQPGDWYLDRPSGKLYYVPMDGEEPETTHVVAPRANALLELRGDAQTGRFVEHLRFEGLTFAHTTWEHPTEEFAASNQAAQMVPGVIRLSGARYCAIEDCDIGHLGQYGVEIGAGCTAIRLVGNEIHDCGAGGVKINGAEEPGAGVTSFVRVTDNEIHHCGRVFHSGVGILSMHAQDGVLSHNHIHDLYYSGISCGWRWGYVDHPSKNNLIEYNHIHDLGFGWLSDMGGIYTLGVQPGTALRGNLIHDVRQAHYGGWAIYPDEGSSHLVIENNIGYRCGDQCFHQHYGRENIVRNNIFAFGSECMIRRTRLEDHVSFTFEKNIILSDGQPIYWGDSLDKGHLIADCNLVWDLSGPVTWSRQMDNEKFLALGYERNSVVADPGFADAKNGDFAVPEDSPALALGFVPFDLSTAGPRVPEERD